MIEASVLGGRYRAPLDPRKPWNFLCEEEPGEDGVVSAVHTLFLTNRECPWRCVMCDLWKNTLESSVPAGAIPAQIDYALARMPSARVIKLYNSGSFFDPRAIPPSDYPVIARQLDAYERVIVECHPALVGEACVRFRDLLQGRLEVAMGLETVHRDVLRRLNKGMTTEDFASAAAFLAANGIDVRTFILLRPPFLDEVDGIFWAQRSLDFAFACGAKVASLIPTRGGNPELDDLAARGAFAPPKIQSLEVCQEYGIGLRAGRVFADLWDLEKFSACAACSGARYQRLQAMNLTQEIPAAVECGACR